MKISNVLQKTKNPYALDLFSAATIAFVEKLLYEKGDKAYPAISERDLLKLPFPKIPAKTCDAIVTAVRSAHAARREAQALLAKAQRAVEIAIEDSEKAALKYLGGVS